MIRIGVLILAFIAVAGVLGAVVLARPDVSVASSVDPQVTIECAGTAGLEEDACRAWGDEILRGGPPSTTFEVEDIVRLRLERSLAGFGDACRADWFLGRYPDDAVWTEAVACAEA